jgi:hypothetical protein
MTRTQVSEALGMHVNTVDRIRRRFVQEGETPALDLDENRDAQTECEMLEVALTHLRGTDVRQRVRHIKCPYS